MFLVEINEALFYFVVILVIVGICYLIFTIKFIFDSHESDRSSPVIYNFTGKKALALSDITPNYGKVTVDGEIWEARLNKKSLITKGGYVIITELKDNNILYVSEI